MLKISLTHKHTHSLSHTHTHALISGSAVSFLPVTIVRNGIKRVMPFVFSFHCSDSTSQVETDDPKHPGLVVIIIFHILMNEDCIKFSRLDLNNHLVNTNSQITGSRGLCNKINCLSTWAGYICYNSDADVFVWSPSEHYRSFACFVIQR